MPMYRKLTTAAAVAALAFGLAACGGGGSDEPTASAPPPAMPPDPMPPAPTPVAVTVTDAMYLDAANMPVAGSTTIAAGATHTSGGVTFLCAEGGDACEVTVAEDGSVTATGGMVTASLTAAAMMQVAEAKAAKADDEEAARLVRRNRAIGEDRAIEAATELPRANTAGLDTSEITIRRGAGVPARVRVSATVNTDTTVRGFAPAELAALPNGEWAGTRLTRMVGTNTETLTVYTDIGSPTRVPFYNFDNDPTTPSLYDSGATPPVDTSSITFTSTTTPPPLTLTAALMTQGTLDPNEFPAPGPSGDGDVTVEFQADTPTASTATVQGNYNGAPGTYVCTQTTAAGDPCVLTVSPTGVYTAVSSSWTFTPQYNANAWRGDGEFMSFGWWLQEPRSEDGTYSYQYYYDAQRFYNTANAGIPIGPATYNGRAAGRYAVQEIDDSGVVDGSTGQFTAAAALTANFSAQPNVTIEGTISGFQGEGDMDMSGWMVTLHRKSIARANLGDGSGGLAATAVTTGQFPNAQSDPTARRFDGTTATIGDHTAYGTWTGHFVGNAMRTNTAGARVPVTNAQPLGVAGVFQADSDAVSIAGAFGARR